MLIPDDVIDQARDQHPKFNPEQHTNRILKRELSRYQRELVGKMVIARKQDLRVTESVAFPLGVFVDGHTIVSELLLVLGGDVFNDAAGVVRSPLFIVPWTNRFDTIPWPAVTWDGQVIHFLGIEKDWATVASVKLEIVTTPATISDPTVASVLPDLAEQTVTGRLAYFMARRDSEVDPSAFRVDWMQAEKDFLRLQSSKNRSTRARVREVYPHGGSGGGYLRLG